MTDFKNEYCMHTATCGELRKEDVGREVVLTGWAWHNRDHGGLIFVDLRDREGYTQVVVDPDCVTPEDFAKAEHLGREYVLKVAGKVRERGADAVNPNMATGEIEVLASAVEVLNTSRDPAVRHRGRHRDGRDHAHEVALPGHPPSGDVRGPAPAPHGRPGHAWCAQRARLPGSGNPHLGELHARRRARLHRAQPSEPGPLLRAAAEPAAVQADAHGGRHRALLPDCPVLPRRGPAR